MIVNESQIREQILALLSRKDYRPLNKIEIALCSLRVRRVRNELSFDAANASRIPQSIA